MIHEYERLTIRAQEIAEGLYEEDLARGGFQAFQDRPENRKIEPSRLARVYAERLAAMASLTNRVDWYDDRLRNVAVSYLAEFAEEEAHEAARGMWNTVSWEE